MRNNFKRPIIIYNPAAGGGKVQKQFTKYYKLLLEEKLFPKMDVYETKAPRDAITKIESLYKEKASNDLIISIGGDGTISEVTNGLMKIPQANRFPLLPLPLGSGNSLLRDFNVTEIKDSIAHYKNDSQTKVDVLKVEEIEGTFKWYCLNVLGMGFIREIADYVVEHGKKLGPLSYVFGTVLALKRFKPYKTTIKYDNGTKEFKSDRVFFLTVSNSKYTGGKIMIAPNAKYNDGLMDVVVLHDINRFQFLNGFRKTGSGKHIDDKGCLYFTTDSLEIYSEPAFDLMPDGDLEGKSPIKVKLLKEQITLIV